MVGFDEDEEVSRFVARAPEEVIVLAAAGGGQVVAEKVDGPGFAVIGGEDDCAGLVGRGELVVSALDDVDFFLPAEAVGIELREAARVVVFGCWCRRCIGGSRRRSGPRRRG